MFGNNLIIIIEWGVNFNIVDITLSSRLVDIMYGKKGKLSWDVQEASSPYF